MRLVEFDSKQKVTDPKISRSQLKLLETYLDKLFAAAGLDVGFTRHFLDRVNDVRNRKQITINELRQIFTKAYRKFNKGKNIADLGDRAQAVLKDMATDLNMPFVLNWDDKNKEFDLIAKTVMRKRGFKTPNKVLAVENGSSNSTNNTNH